jgi:hypothetical protein
MTASSSVERSHSACTTELSRCRLVHYSGGRTLRLRHARSQGVCRTSEQHGLRDRRRHRQHARNTTLHHEAMECMRTCNGSPGTERTNTRDRTQPIASSVAQYIGRARCSIANRTETYYRNVGFTSLQTHTHAQHARGALSACSRCACNAPHNRRSTEHTSVHILRADVTRSAQTARRRRA